MHSVIGSSFFFLWSGPQITGAEDTVKQLEADLKAVSAEAKRVANAYSEACREHGKLAAEDEANLELIARP